MSRGRKAQRRRSQQNVVYGKKGLRFKNTTLRKSGDYVVHLLMHLLVTVFVKVRKVRNTRFVHCI